MEFNTMVEVVLVGAMVDDSLDGENVVFATEGVCSYAVTNVEPDTMENTGDIVYTGEGIVTGFARCGTVTIEENQVIVYYVVDMDNTELGSKLFVLDKVVDESI